MFARPHGSPPPASVLAAFDIDVPVLALAGGQSTSYLAGNLVLKPSESPNLDSFILPIIASLPPSNEYRTPHPVAVHHVASPDVSKQLKAGPCYIANGWTCIEYFPNTQTLLPPHLNMTLQKYKQIITVSRAFHLAIKDLVREEPEVIKKDSSRWANGARVAFGEAPWTKSKLTRVERLMRKLQELLLALEKSSKEDSKCSDEGEDEETMNLLVHCDLAGNVLYSETAEAHNLEIEQASIYTPPKPKLNPPLAIIDISPYWRPRLFAESIVAADGLIWQHAEEGILLEATSTTMKAEMLIRAVIFRVVAEQFEEVEEFNEEMVLFEGALERIEKVVRKMFPNLA